MSPKNDFKAFSISNNANVVSQRLYEESKDLLTGFPPNDVPTHILNKALRQSSTISSVLANFIAAQSGDDVLDDGDIAKLTAQLNRALEQKTTTKVPDASLTQKGVVQLTDVVGNSDTLAVTQKLAQEIINLLREDINNRVPNTRKVNGKALSTDISLSAVDVGAYTKAEVNNLINAVNNIPVGAPIPWPTAIPPVGWLQCNGAAFDKSKFPKLAEAYPDGRLPDLRGEFIRGWDDGRGIDPNRSLLEWQEGSYLLQEGGSGDFVLSFSLNNLKVLQWDAPQNKTLSLRARVARPISTWDAMAASYIGVSRPRNIAFNYIVRVA
ncbi:phage tail protein [Photorhabdus khanii]|uniref:Phage tail protein n=1 Tax=Photorhabdus khanii subsp. guanajuatensis TaxID=2100166 RepID=A0A4R4JMB7_9GAMM|nr:phage tail protein [Photorhabdus khanii]TDB54199.1 phage tail protein [Photorhabdus khanii subsp. guanajuatensis]